MQEQYYQQYYDAELTHWWFRARLRIVTNLLRKFAPSARPLPIADVGCGMGASFDALSKFGPVLGVDISPTALAFSRRRGVKRLAAAALPSLPLRSETFQVVCALDVIEHVDDDYAAVRELWRICAPGGLLVITVPAYEWLWSEHDDVNEHKRRYTRGRLEACLRQPDGEFLKLSYMNTFLAPPLMFFRGLKNLRSSGKPAAQSAHSDVFDVPPLINRTLEGIFSAESPWLNHARFPFGISLVCIARKKTRLP